MAAYLEDHPPRIRQFRYPRRATPSGVVVVHTAESYPDEKGPDTGAESVARFIRDRTNPGSYHDLCDSDSTVDLVPYDAEAYHDGTGSNPHSYGVSAATQAAKWNSLGDDWVDATVRNMARAAARYARWIKAEYGVTIPARRITRAQSSDRVPGFISHGERDPGRRTDPGSTFPWKTFLAYYAAEMGGTTPKPTPTPTPTPEDDMPTTYRGTTTATTKLVKAQWVGVATILSGHGSMTGTARPHLTGAEDTEIHYRFVEVEVIDAAKGKFKYLYDDQASGEFITGGGGAYPSLPFTVFTDNAKRAIRLEVKAWRDGVTCQSVAISGLVWR
jgi:hypothetical protein